jgi:hypothetical protein
MEHQTLDALREKAAVLDAPRPLASKNARLLRWADLLAGESHERAGLVHGFEFGYERSVILKQEWSRNQCSPFRVAYADPALRAEGFVRGIYEEAIHFFSLTDRETHYLLCDCHYAPFATFGDVARRARRVARHPLLASIGASGILVPCLLAGTAMLLLPYLIR